MFRDVMFINMKWSFDRTAVDPVVYKYGHTHTTHDTHVPVSIPEAP